MNQREARSGHTSNLDLDIDLDKTFTEGVDLDETGIDGLVELAELGDKTDIALVDLLVGVGAEDTAGHGTDRADAGAEGIDHGTVPALGVGVAVDDLGIALLQILRARALDRHGGLRTEDGRVGRGAVRVALVGRLSCGGRRHGAALGMGVHVDQFG